MKKTRKYGEKQKKTVMKKTRKYEEKQKNRDEENKKILKKFKHHESNIQ